MTRLRRLRRLGVVAVGVLALVAATPSVSATALELQSAAAGDVGYRGPHFIGNGTEVTGAKPESKLWRNDGYWWASMWDEVARANFIYRRDAATETWTKTGVRVDDRAGTRADALWDGTKLYVASHVFSTIPGSGSPARLYRYSYSPTAKTYTLDPGFPVTINNFKTETLVIDKDSTGKLWATWVQSNTVYVNRTMGNDQTWGTPFALPVAGASGLSADDISSLVAFAGKVGVMWSNQNAPAMYFAVHVDGQPETSWTRSTALSGSRMADDHINLKAGLDGRVFAAVKTSVTSSGAPLVLLLVRDIAGGWSSHVFGQLRDHHTRPIVLLEETARRIHMFATSGESGGTIYRKTSSLDSISFESGVGTPFIRDTASEDMNDATSTKQNVTGTTDLVVMASNDSTDYYWHNFEELNASPVAADAVVTTNEDEPKLITLAATDAEGSPLTYAIVDGPGHGSVSVLSGASVTYTPAPNYNGPDSFRFNATDGALDSNTATVSITVQPVNDAPSLSIPDVSFGEGSQRSIALADHWSDVETPAASALFTVHGSQFGGTAAVESSTQTLVLSAGDNMEGDISVDGTDGGDGASPPLTTLDTVHVTVTNVAPTITFSSVSPTTIDEGSPAAAEYTYRYTITEPGNDTVTVSGISCGGGTLVAGSATNTNTEGTFKCTFDASEGPAAYTVAAVATDSDNATGPVATQVVTIRNLPATVTTTSPVNGMIYLSGMIVLVSADFRDKGTTDAHTCTITWGDGTTTPGTVIEAGGVGKCQGSKAYTVRGMFAIVVNVTDDDGGTGRSAPTTVTVL